MTLAKIFQTGMLLQREMPVNVWGYAAPGEKIQVSVQGKSAETDAGPDGRWMLCLPAMRTSCGETMIVQGEKEQIKLEDIAVGEIFVAAGQSNMEFWMKYEKHYQEMLQTCENPHIRFYDMPKLSYDGQEKDFDYHNVGIWRKASKENLAYFSSAGYYFAKKLEEDLSVPAGIIGCNWGGTRSLAWMKEEHGRRIQKEQTADFEAKLKGRSYEEFCQAAGKNPMNDTGNSTWNPFNDFILPGTPSDEEIQAFLAQDACAGQEMDAKPQDAPGALYRHMVKKLAPYTVRGVLWYQGESDDEINGTQKNYKEALDAVKEDWRDAWHNAALPFFVVQLPGLTSWFGCVCRGFPIIRECQQKSVDEDENAYLCSVSDAGEEFDIHPKNKAVVGERLALLAQRHLFGKNILADPPRLKDIQREGNEITLSFENAEGGLSVDGDKVNALKVITESHEIDYSFMVSDENIVLNLPESITGKITVKFARDLWYRVNLYNQAGIPAIPFEADCN